MTKTKAITKTATKEQNKQISLNLDQSFNPNPGLTKTYADARATDIFIDKDLRPEYRNEARIFAAAAASKKLIRHNIFAIYREQRGSKEFCYFFDLMVARDYWQNKIDHTRLIGKWEKPVITQKFGLDVATLKSDSSPQPGGIGDPEVESMETIYDYPWEQMRDQLLKWKEAGVIGDKSIFYVVIGNRKYSAPYSWEQFINLSIPDLQLIGEHGRKFTGLLSAQDPETLQVLKATMKQEISKGLLTSK